MSLYDSIYIVNSPYPFLLLWKFILVLEDWGVHEQEALVRVCANQLSAWNFLFLRYFWDVCTMRDGKVIPCLSSIKAPVVTVNWQRYACELYFNIQKKFIIEECLESEACWCEHGLSTEIIRKMFNDGIIH